MGVGWGGSREEPSYLVLLLKYGLDQSDFLAAVPLQSKFLKLPIRKNPVNRPQLADGPLLTQYVIS